MTLLEVLKLANKVEGSFVDLGFGKGTQAKEIYNFMLDNSITRRNCIFVDQFKGGTQGIWQKAHDLSNEVKNRLKQLSSYQKIDILNESISLSEKPALVNLDLEKNTVEGLKQIFPLLAPNGVIVVRNHSKEIDKYLTSLIIASKVVNLDNFSYIIKKNRTQSSKIKRTRSVLT